MADSTITIPTSDRIRDIILSRLLGSPGFSGADTAKGGFFWRLADAFARQGRSLLVRAASAWKFCLPSEATGVPGARWADTVLGEGASAATKWTGTIRVRCVNNTQTVLAGQTGTQEDGTVYATTAVINPTDWVSGGTYYYCDTAAESVTRGSVANKATGTPITLAAPPAGVYDVAHLQTTTTEAEDAETAEELQARVVQRLRERPGGGSCADYRAWCQEVPGVYDAMVYPRWEGAGAAGNNTVRCVILGPPGDRLLADYPGGAVAAEAAVTALLATRGPLFAATTKVHAPVAKGQTVFVTVRTAPGYGPDYDYAAYSPTVLGVDAGLRKVTLSVDPTGKLVPGNRFVVADSTYKTIQHTVQSVHVGYVIVEDTWDNDPQIGKTIRPGGPLFDPLRAAVEGVFDRLGTSASSTAGKVRWPHSDVELPSTLYLSDLYEAIAGVPGVVSSLITTPATDITNTAAETVAPDLIQLVGTAGVSDFQVAWETAT